MDLGFVLSVVGLVLTLSERHEQGTFGALLKPAPPKSYSSVQLFAECGPRPVVDYKVLRLCSSGGVRDYQYLS